MSQKPDAIVEMNKLEMTGQVTLLELIKIKWQVWNPDARRYTSGIVDKGLYKVWQNGGYKAVPKPNKAQVSKVFIASLHPSQEVLHYSRKDKQKKTGRVSNIELSIKSTDFKEIIAAMAEKAVINGIKTVTLENFSFGYEMQVKSIDNNEYKSIKKAIPLDMDDGVASIATNNQSIPDF